MKTLITLMIFIPLVSSCQDYDSLSFADIHYRTWKIPLQSGLGACGICLPTTFDTLFVWTENSDCGDPCAHIDYRIQSKRSRVFKDNGMFYTPLQDSVEQFTIKHEKIVYYSKLYDTADYIIEKLTNYLKSKSYENPTNKYLLDTVIKIGRGKFAVIAFAGYSKKYKTNIQTLKAITSYKGAFIEISFEQRKKQIANHKLLFIQEGLKCLQTLRL